MHQPDATAFADWPAFGGTCYTPIYMATPVQVTQHGLSSITATSTFSATDTLRQAYAYPYEGFAYGVPQIPSIEVSNTATTTTSSSGSSSTGSAAAATFTIPADTDPVFTPSTLQAKLAIPSSFNLNLETILSPNQNFKLLVTQSLVGRTAAIWQILIIKSILHQHSLSV